MWDKFHKTWIYCLFALIVGCSGCAMLGNEADLVEDMADNCKMGLKRAEVTQDDDDKSVKIECAGYSL